MPLVIRTCCIRVGVAPAVSGWGLRLPALTNWYGVFVLEQKIRVGRGRSGRRPKTAGRGHKGTGQHGNIAFWYQGGQTPIWRLLPKRGGRNK